MPHSPNNLTLVRSFKREDYVPDSHEGIKYKTQGSIPTQDPAALARTVIELYNGDIDRARRTEPQPYAVLPLEAGKYGHPAYAVYKPTRLGEARYVATVWIRRVSRTEGAERGITGEALLFNHNHIPHPGFDFDKPKPKPE